MGGCAPAELGQNPDVIWWTDHETGDFADWDRGGYHWSAGGGSIDISTSPEPVRSGRHSLRSVVTSVATGQSSAGAARSDGLPTEAYYSAWYFFPVPITTTGYWLFFKFRALDPSDGTTKLDVWDLDVITDNSGPMRLSLYQHGTPSNQFPAPNTSIPIGRWFQVEAFLRAARDNSGRLTIWFDGEQVFEQTDSSTMPSSLVEWDVGGVTEAIVPDPATMFIDDACVSKHRLGPEFPIFSR